MDVREVKFLNAFLHIPGIGEETLRLLKKRFGAFETAWRAGDAAIAASKIPPARVSQIQEWRPRLDPDTLIQKVVRENIWILTEEDKE